MLTVQTDCDKRRNERKDIIQLISVTNVMTGQNLGQVVNLSLDGFMLIGSGQIKEDCLYQLNFHLSEAEQERATLSLGAECLWIRETDSGTQYWAGFHIMDISDEDSAFIAALLA